MIRRGVRKFNIMQIKLIILEPQFLPLSFKFARRALLKKWRQSTYRLSPYLLYLYCICTSKNHSVVLQRKTLSQVLTSENSFCGVTPRIATSPTLDHVYPPSVKWCCCLLARVLEWGGWDYKTQLYLWFICTSQSDNAVKLSAQYFAIVSLICSYYLLCWILHSSQATAFLCHPLASLPIKATFTYTFVSYPKQWKKVRDKITMNNKKLF